MSSKGGLSPKASLLIGECALSDYRPLDGFLPRAALPQIDLARSIVFLFRRDGERILWASEAARRFLGLRAGEDISGRRLGPLLPSTQRLRFLGEVLQAGSPPRLERIPFFVNLRSDPLTCVCRIVPLREGAEGLLLTAKEVRLSAFSPALPPPPASMDESAVITPDRVPPGEAKQALPSPPAMPLLPAPWTPSERMSLRFTFDSDPQGTIEAVSSEFAKAVGPKSAAIAGLNWRDIATRLNEPEARELARLSATPEPFRGVSLHWWMDDGRRVPIEISGAPRLVKGACVGLRGFGLVKLSEATTVTDDNQPTVAPSTPLTEAADAARQIETSQTEAGKALSFQSLSSPTPRQDASPALDRLTQQERLAFRDIARALGARFEDEAPIETVIGPLPNETLPAAVMAEDTSLPFDLDEEADENLSPVSELPSWPLEQEAGSDAPLDDEKTDDEDLNAPDSDDAAFNDPRIDLLDRLPLGVLVMREGKAVFMNETLLGLLGHETLATFETVQGVDQLFAGPIPQSDSAGLASTSLKKTDGSTTMVDAHLQMVPWYGGMATLFSFRRQREDKLSLPSPSLQSELPLPLARQGGNAALEAQLRARDSELSEYRAMLDTATDGVISMGADGHILAANRPVEALFGYDASELVGERLTKLFASESHAAVVDYLDGLNAHGLQSILAQGRSVFGRERNGGRIPLFLTIGKVSASGKLCAVLRDMTNWTKAEADLTDARKAADAANSQKSQFLAKISHEIRTPMNSIIGFAEVMMDGAFGPIGNERYADYLKDIHRSGQHVVSLVNDLLDLSKIEAGKADLSFGSVNLNEIVASCVSMMEPQALREKVFLRMQLDAALPMVVADERSLRQIIINLLSNSTKFNMQGGQVVASTALNPHGEVVVRIRDTGIGMTPADLELAMQPFKQVPTSTKGSGTGLGLPLTKALTEANRASLKMSSKPGEGTLAEIVFPPTRVLAE
jgi:PAS domain S-box-containing protein